MTSHRARRIQQLGIPIPAREDRDWVTSTELEAEVAITYRQLDYWCRTGLLVPMDAATPGSGHVRRFDQAQVERSIAIAGLLNAGFSLQLCRVVIDDLVRDGRVDVGPFTLTIRHDQSGDTAA